MAERRMFAKTIIDSDAFIDMPTTSRLLYYDLSMRADDDGFVNSPKKIMRMIGASEDDLKILLAKRFLFCFESGVVVIKHWLIHNYIRKDTYTDTNYKEEKATLSLDENKAYTLKNTERPRPVDDTSTQVRLGKVRVGKDRLGKGRVGNNTPARELTTTTFNLDSFFELYKQHAPTLFKKDFPDGREKSDGSCAYEAGQLFFSARDDEYNPLTEEKTITLFEKAEASDYIQTWTRPILVTVLKLKEKVLSGKYEKNFKGGQYGKPERPKADIPELGQTF